MPVPGDFEVRDEEAERIINDIGNLLRRAMPPGWGFALLMVEFNKAEGGTFYTSNCDRNDVCNMMREFMQRHQAN